MIPGLQKLRYLLASRPELVARICIAVALVSALGVGFTFTNPPTTEVTDADHQTIATTLNSQATVEEGSSLYTRGEVLSDMPVYSRSASPNATVSAVTSPPRDEEMQVDQRITLTYEARTGSDETFWRQTRRLGGTNASTTGDEVVSNATINIHAIDRRLTELETEIGDGGQVTAYLEVETRYSTGHDHGTFTDRGAITIRDDSYEINHLSMRDTYGTTETVTRPVPSKIIRFSVPFIGGLVVPHTTFIFVLLGVIGVIGIGVTVTFAHRFDQEAERVALHKARYAEWISSGKLPSHQSDRTVYMNSLEDLVDVAIDSDKRIIHDPAQDRYAVLDEHTTYVYQEETITGGTESVPGNYTSTDSALTEEEDESELDERVADASGEVHETADVFQWQTADDNEPVESGFDPERRE